MKIELSEETVQNFKDYKNHTGGFYIASEASKYKISGMSLYQLWVKNNYQSSFDWPVCKVCRAPLKESQFFKKSQTCCRECNAKDPDRKKKAESTWLKKYGVDKFWNSKEIQEKAKKTRLDRYGFESAAKNKQIQDKIKATNKQKYGVDYPFQNMDIQDKVKETIVEKYGVDNVSKLPEMVQQRTKNQRSQNFERFKEVCFEMFNVSLTSTKDQFINDDILHFHCNRCNQDFERERSVAQICRCPYCCGRTSEGEKEVETHIRSIYNGIVQHHNKSLSENREIDIYLPELKLGFEYNGNFYHSTHRKDKFYHQKKTQDALDLGIRIVHIFEYQWDNFQEQCKKLIQESIEGNYDYSKLDLNNVNWNEVDIRPLLQQGYKIEKYNDLQVHYLNYGEEITKDQYDQLPENLQHNACLIYDAGTIVLNNPS